jgi:hypothetical protein
MTALGLRPRNLPPNCETRWVSRWKALQTFVECLPAIFLALHDVAEGQANEDTDGTKKASAKVLAKLKAVLESLEDYSVILTAAAMLPMFKQLHALIH